MERFIIGRPLPQRGVGEVALRGGGSARETGTRDSGGDFRPCDAQLPGATPRLRTITRAEGKLPPGRWTIEESQKAVRRWQPYERSISSKPKRRSHSKWMQRYARRRSYFRKRPIRLLLMNPDKSKVLKAWTAKKIRAEGMSDKDRNKKRS